MDLIELNASSIILCFPPHILEEILILQFILLHFHLNLQGCLTSMIWYEHLFQTFIILNFWKCILLKLRIAGKILYLQIFPFQTCPLPNIPNHPPPPPKRCPGRSKLTDRDFIKISPSVAAIILRSGSARSFCWGILGDESWPIGSTCSIYVYIYTYICIFFYGKCR